jgi:hypothetical protein
MASTAVNLSFLMWDKVGVVLGEEERHGSQCMNPHISL